MTADAEHHTHAPTADSAAISGLRRAHVRAALAQLPPEHRQVITEMYFRGHSVTEISRTLGIPAAMVKSRTYQGLRQLRRAVRAMSADMASPPDASWRAGRSYRDVAVNTPQ